VWLKADQEVLDSRIRKRIESMVHRDKGMHEAFNLFDQMLLS
jgi:tRNA A37 N6-isopentenylltransferase MiaA